MGLVQLYTILICILFKVFFLSLNGLNILDSIIGLNGRITEVKVQNIQIWNEYIKSGYGFKKERELFVKEQFCEFMVQWKDSTKYIFQLGDQVGRFSL